MSEAALGYWQLRARGAATTSQLLLMADTLLMRSAAGPRRAGCTWYVSDAPSRYGLGSAVWPSARAQGQAISALLRAHAVRADERYLAAARAAVVPMTVDVADGGVARRIDGRLVLESHPVVAPVASLVGWLYALVGLHELDMRTADEAARALLTESLSALVELLPRYDRGCRSLASLHDVDRRMDVATAFEHRLAALLLGALARLDPRLAVTAEAWRAGGGFGERMRLRRTRRDELGRVAR